MSVSIQQQNYIIPTEYDSTVMHAPKYAWLTHKARDSLGQAWHVQQYKP